MRLMFLLSATMLLPWGAAAINPVQYVFEQLQLLHSSNMSYNYKIQLVDLNTGQTLDSNMGKLCRSGLQFLDSNRDYYTIRTNQYFCKLNRLDKKAFIYNIQALRRRLKIDLPITKGDLNLVDSIGFKQGSFKTDTTDKLNYKFSWTLETSTKSTFTAYVDKKNYRLNAVTIERAEYEGPNHAYNRICSIYNIRNVASGSFNSLSRIFSITGNKVKLALGYENYTVKSLID